MKTKILAAALPLLLQASLAHASPFSPWTILGRSTIQATVDPSAIKCSNGLLPNGHNYPVYASVSMNSRDLRRTVDGLDYTGWYDSNVSEYAVILSGFYDCKDLPAALKVNRPLNVTAKQTIGEIFQTHADGTCEKTLSESVDVTVEGIAFVGESHMTVHPIDPKLCPHAQP